MWNCPGGGVPTRLGRPSSLTVGPAGEAVVLAGYSVRNPYNLTGGMSTGDGGTRMRGTPHPLCKRLRPAENPEQSHASDGVPCVPVTVPDECGTPPWSADQASYSLFVLPCSRNAFSALYARSLPQPIRAFTSSFDVGGGSRSLSTATSATICASVLPSWIP